MKIISREDGNTLIESALCLPIITLMLLLVADFGVVLDQNLRVMDSTRAAAESAVTRTYANNLTYVTQVANLSATGIPGYNVNAVNYCTCADGSSQFVCSSFSACSTYGLPNRYVKVTATASLPLFFGVAGLPANINVKSVSIARIAWTGIP